MLALLTIQINTRINNNNNNNIIRIKRFKNNRSEGWGKRKEEAYRFVILSVRGIFYNCMSKLCDDQFCFLHSYFGKERKERRVRRKKGDKMITFVGGSSGTKGALADARIVAEGPS